MPLMQRAANEAAAEDPERLVVMLDAYDALFVRPASDCAVRLRAMIDGAPRTASGGRPVVIGTEPDCFVNCHAAAARKCGTAVAVPHLNSGFLAGYAADVRAILAGLHGDDQLALGQRRAADCSAILLDDRSELVANYRSFGPEGVLTGFVQLLPPDRPSGRPRVRVARTGTFPMAVHTYGMGHDGGLRYNSIQSHVFAELPPNPTPWPLIVAPLCGLGLLALVVCVFVWRYGPGGRRARRPRA
jgi:hypothetical protein